MPLTHVQVAHPKLMASAPLTEMQASSNRPLEVEVASGFHITRLCHNTPSWILWILKSPSHAAIHMKEITKVACLCEV